jgi:hypothetical protein
MMFSATVTLGAPPELTNGDFEAPGAAGAEPQGWKVTAGKLQLDNKIHVTGEFAAKLDGGDSAAMAHQDIEVEPGKAYVLSGQWRNGDRTAEFDVVSATISWLDKVDGRERGVASEADSGAVVSNWKAFQLTPVIVPANVHAMRITLKSRFGIGAFDGLSLSETDVAAAQAAIAAAAQPKTGVTPSGRVAGGGSAGVLPGVQDVAVTSLPGVSPQLAASQAPAEAPSPAVHRGSVSWLTDLNAARNSGKPLLLFFSDNDAELSRHIEDLLGADAALRSALGKFTAVRLDFVANKQVAYALKVYRAGTVLLYDAQGNCRGEITSALTASEMIAKLSGI